MWQSIQDEGHPGVGIKKTKQSSSTHGNSRTDFHHAWSNSTLLDGANACCVGPDWGGTLRTFSRATRRTIYLRGILEYAVKSFDHWPEVAQQNERTRQQQPYDYRHQPPFTRVRQNLFRIIHTSMIAQPTMGIMDTHVSKLFT